MVASSYRTIFTDAIQVITVILIIDLFHRYLFTNVIVCGIYVMLLFNILFIKMFTTFSLTFSSTIVVIQMFWRSSFHVSLEMVSTDRVTVLELMCFYTTAIASKPYS